MLSPTAAEDRAAVTAAIMAAEPKAEQLGYISRGEGDAHICLQMAGGEFCGNACLSAAAYYLMENSLEEASVRVAISGAEKNVTVDIKKEADGSYSGFVYMPLPTGIGSFEGFILVSFPGISHAIVPYSISTQEAEDIIVPLCEKLKVDALGLMLYNKKKTSLTPLVYVPGAKSLFWEQSCASGTAALAAAIATQRRGHARLSLSQPGGTLSVEAKWNGKKVSSIRLGGRVDFLPEKYAEI